jgi:hypothetical protein
MRLPRSRHPADAGCAQAPLPPFLKWPLRGRRHPARLRHGQRRGGAFTLHRLTTYRRMAETISSGRRNNLETSAGYGPRQSGSTSTPRHAGLDCQIESRNRMHTIAGCRAPREATGVGVRLLRVTLRAQPSDAAFAVHPLVDFSFAFETTNVNRLDTRTLGEDIPFALSNSHRFESYFCFGHALLWQKFELKSKASRKADR